MWADEFDSTKLNIQNWTFERGIKNENWPEYRGNNELEFYTGRPENARVENGNLVITARIEEYQGMSYTSARLKTHPNFSWLYGKFEARIKLPIGKGIWPAFWMMPLSNRLGPWPASGEIDIMEYIGDQPATVYGTMHYGIQSHHTSGSNYSLTDSTFHEDYHTFSLGVCRT